MLYAGVEPAALFRSDDGGINPCGVYVGTTAGQIFYSRDEGDSWKVLVEHLPPINSLEVAITA